MSNTSQVQNDSQYIRPYIITLILVVLIAGALFTETALGKIHSESHNVPHPLPFPQLSSPQTAGITANDETNGRVEILVSQRISIPFGVSPILPLYDSGQKVLVSGHGGCTAAQIVSVVITVTQMTGASAVGQIEEICTGNLQQWNLTATVITGTNLEATEAEACGVAVTRSNGYVTDSFKWCRDVDLTSHHNYLPIIRVQP
jgi:hypothetical protein